MAVAIPYKLPFCTSFHSDYVHAAIPCKLSFRTSCHSVQAAIRTGFVFSQQLVPLDCCPRSCTYLRICNIKSFEWLGHWYRGVARDTQRARGCYVRALKLDTSRKGAGEGLALIYLDSGQVISPHPGRIVRFLYMLLGKERRD